MCLVAFVALSLAGCSDQRPAVEVRTMEVLKPVPVPCVKREQIPAAPPSIRDKLTGNAAADIGPIAASALELRQALNEALALLGGCVQP